MFFKDWERAEKIAALSLMLSFFVAICGYFIKEDVRSIELKVDPVLKLEPTIINNNNNIIEVKKEIANLIDVIKERGELEEKEQFRQSDIGSRVRYFERPEGAPKTTANFIFFELAKIPIGYSVEIHAQNGPIAKGTFEVEKNIVRANTLNPISTFLDKDTEFFNVYYVPDADAKGELNEIENLQAIWDLNGGTVTWRSK